MRVRRIGYVDLRTDEVDAMTSFVRAPDGRVFAIEQVPDQPSGGVRA